MYSKKVFADLVKSERLDETNYDIGCAKIQCLLNEVDILETITNAMGESMISTGNIEVMLKTIKADLTNVFGDASLC